MNAHLLHSMAQSALLGVVALFLVLYVGQLTGGVAPELALIRAGGVGICLAGTLRLLLLILEHAPAPKATTATSRAPRAAPGPGGVTGGTQIASNPELAVDER